MLPSRSHFHRWQDIITYLETAIRNVNQVPRPANQEFFSLNHNDLRLGFNTMVRGTKVVGLIDWETASYDALPFCIEDITDYTDFNPREWWAHAGRNGVNFNVLPYRLEADDTEARLDNHTSQGADRKPFPDWDLIENHGGPLGEEDFFGDDYPEDISSSDEESIIDPAEMHCDSDVEAEELCVLPGGDGRLNQLEALRRGLAHHELSSDWYYEPVYALMREFIHRQRGAGLGPDGEWGRLPEAYSRPLAEWMDPLYQRVTQRLFEALHGQLINEERADADHRPVKAKAKAHTAKKSKSQPRQRRVPTLMDGWRDAAAGTEISPESLESSRVSWTTDCVPRRIRPRTPPRPWRAVGPNPDPIPLSPSPREQVPTGARQRGKADRPPVRPPPADFRVRAVRDKVTAKITQQLMARLRRRAEAR